MARLLIPTPRLGFLALFGVAAIPLEYLGLPGYGLASLWFLLLMGAVVVDWWTSFGRLRIRAETDLPETISRDVTYHYRLYLVWLGLPNQVVGEASQDQPAGVEAHPSRQSFVSRDDHVVLERTIRVAGRGRLPEPTVRVRISSRLGLCLIQLGLSTGRELAVMPDFSPLKNLRLATTRKRLERLGYRLIKQAGEGGEFHHLREFVPGDDIRRVSWRAVAKHYKPIVVETQKEREQALLVVVDAGRMSATPIMGRTRLDHFLRSAIQLLVTASMEGDRTGLMVYAGQLVSYVPPEKRWTNLGELVASLADVFPQAEETDYLAMVRFIARHFHHQGIVVVMSELTDSLSSERLVRALSTLRRRHQVILLTLYDPAALGAFARPAVGQVGESFRRAVVGEWEMARYQTQQRLSHLGVAIVDAHPEMAHELIVNRYIESRRRLS